MERKPEEALLEDGEALMARLVAKITSGARNRSTVGRKTVKLEIAGENAFKRVAKEYFGVAVADKPAVWTWENPNLTHWLPSTEIPLLYYGEQDGTCRIEDITIRLYKGSGKVTARSNNRHFNNAGKEKISRGN